MLTTSSKKRNFQITDEAIFEEIYNAIVEHRMPPGMKLTEDALGDIFHISRTRIRKILFRLEHQGIIVIESNRGAFVAKPTLKEARDVFEARRFIEIGMIKSVCNIITSEQIDNLNKIHEVEQKAIVKQEQGLAIRLSGDFHLAIARCSNNEVLIKFLGQLVSKTSLIIAVFERKKSTACLTDEHEELLQALISRDSEKATFLMGTHLKHVEADLSLYEPHEVELTDVFQGLMGKYYN